MDPDLLALLTGDQFGVSAPPNFLQTASPAPQEQPAPPPADPHPVMAAANADAPTMPVKRRHSLADILGGIADGIAQAGGATPMYQKTVQGAEDRALALADHDLATQAAKVKLATDKFSLGDAQNTRLGQAMRGLKAIRAAGGDVDAAWPELAARMQIDPQTAQSIGAHLAQNPTDIDGLIAAMTDPKLDQSHYGGSVVYAKGIDGKIHAYQPSLADDPARDILPEGVEAIDPPKAVDLGGSTAIVGTRTGGVTKILPKTARPDTILTTGTSRENNIRDNNTKITIAGMPARTAAGKNGASNPAMVETAQGNLDELKNLYGDLHKMGALVSPAQSKDKNVIARIRASGIGQTLEGAVGTEAQTKRDRIASIRPQLMQSLAKATGMTGKQLDSNADVKLFMATVTDPTKSYEANMAAIQGLERFLKANSKPAAAAGSTPVRPVTPRPKAKSGWTIVKVQ